MKVYLLTVNVGAYEPTILVSVHKTRKGAEKKRDKEVSEKLFARKDDYFIDEHEVEK